MPAFFISGAACEYNCPAYRVNCSNRVPEMKLFEKIC